MIFAVNSPETAVETIDIKYMESGHSYLECDSMHSLIERAKKHPRVYTTGKMRVIVEGVRQNPQPFVVQQINFANFLYFKTLFDKVVRNFNLISDGQKVAYLKVKWFRFQRGSENILFKYDYDDQFSSLNFLADPIVLSPPK